MKELNDADFHNETKKGIYVIDFWADWCGPCKMMAPIFEELSKEMKNINFAKVNVDESSDIANEFQIMSIPTIVVMKDGEEIDRIVGAMPKSVLKAKILEILG